MSYLTILTPHMLAISAPKRSQKESPRLNPFVAFNFSDLKYYLLLASIPKLPLRVKIDLSKRQAKARRLDCFESWESGYLSPYLCFFYDSALKKDRQFYLLQRQTLKVPLSINFDLPKQQQKAARKRSQAKELSSLSFTLILKLKEYWCLDRLLQALSLRKEPFCPNQQPICVIQTNLFLMSLQKVVQSTYLSIHLNLVLKVGRVNRCIYFLSSSR